MNALIKKRFLFPVVIFIFFSLLNSCSNKNNTAEKNEINQNKEFTKINENDFQESDEDIFTVDYKEFYDELSPQGEWIQVDGEEMGLNLKSGTASGEYEIQKDLYYYITGVKNAYADDLDLGMFFVWKPSPDLAVAIGTNPAPVQYTPYYNGQWLNTDAGWYFKAPTPAEEITVHYGRWVSSPGFGWVWVPGRVWAPAWVDWRENENYIAWAPIPPGGYIVNNVVSTPFIEYDKYVVVEKRYFAEPLVYSYIVPGDRYVIIKETAPVTGVTIVNNIIIDKGPNIVNIKQFEGKDVIKVKINKVNNINSAGFSSNTINVYTPQFKKIKTKGKIITTANQPSNFVSNEETKNMQNAGKEKSNDNSVQGNKNNEKNLNNEKGSNSEKNNYKESNENKNKIDNSQDVNKNNKDKENDNSQGKNDGSQKNNVNKNNKGDNNNSKNDKSKNNSQDKGGNKNKGKGKK